MRRKLTATAVLLATVPAVAGCTGHHVAHRSDLGTAAGTLVFVGAAVGPTAPVPGTVTAVSSRDTRSEVTVGKDGRFSLSLPAGSYQLTGHSPKVLVNGDELLCIAVTHSVRIMAHRITRGIEIICDPQLPATLPR